MRKDFSREWQEAGLMNGTTADLDRIFTADFWQVPTEIELLDENLLWSTVSGFKTVHPGSGMLEGFLRLHTAQPQEIHHYAKRWGVLGICKHALPESHSYPCFNRSIDDILRICTPVESGKYPGRFEESIESWRKYSKVANLLLSLVANLRKGVPGKPEHWSELSEWSTPTSGIKITSTRLKSNRERAAEIVQRWLDLGGVRPFFRWDSTAPNFALGAPSRYGLFGALGVQLLLMVNLIDGFAICVGCGNPYTPHRRPQAGRRNYCETCRDKKIPVRHAMKDLRSRESKKRTGRKQYGKKRRS